MIRRSSKIASFQQTGAPSHQPRELPLSPPITTSHIHSYQTPLLLPPPPPPSPWPPFFTEIMIEWLCIANIGSKQFDQKYLQDAPSSASDECDKIQEAQMQDCKSPCAPYTNTKGNTRCVLETRIQGFFSPGTMIRSQYNRELRFKVLHADILMDDTKRRVNLYSSIDDIHIINIYYIFLESLQPPYHRYVVFPVGMTSDYLRTNNPTLNSFFDTLIEFIKTVMQQDEEEEGRRRKCVFCGHSMGCVLAYLFAGRFIKNNRAVFRQNCWILGTAPRQNLNLKIPLFEEKIVRSCSSIFVFGVFLKRKTIRIDRMQNGDRLPFHIITADLQYLGDDDDSSEHRLKLISDFSEIQKILTHPPPTSDITEMDNEIYKMHSWEYYLDALYSLMYSSAPSNTLAKLVELQRPFYNDPGFEEPQQPDDPHHHYGGRRFHIHNNMKTKRNMRWPPLTSRTFRRLRKGRLRKVRSRCTIFPRTR